MRCLPTDPASCEAGRRGARRAGSRGAAIAVVAALLATLGPAAGPSGCAPGSGGDVPTDAVAGGDDGACGAGACSDGGPDPGLDGWAGVDGNEPGDAGPVDDRGFRVRVPSSHRIPIEGPGLQSGWTDASDLDWMCTFRHDGLYATFYIQDRPLKDRGWILGGITWQTVGAWMSVDGAVEPVAAQYDSGGNHRNDWIDVAFRGAAYRWYHSSFSLAWRKCQAMDCLQAMDPDDLLAPPLEDGCTSDRTLPAWCVAVKADGTVPPLVDAFHKCPDDPYP